MGWKTLKDEYKIGHIVQVTEEGICIGSPYVHDFIIIDLNGDIKKRYDTAKWSGEGDLARYQKDFDEDLEKLKRIVTQKDVFEKSLPVFTFDGSDIIQEFCEKYDWPNITHNGNIMYENTYSPDKEKVIEWAKKNAISRKTFCEETFSEVLLEKDKRLNNLKERILQAEKDISELMEKYPEKEAHTNE